MKKINLEVTGFKELTSIETITIDGVEYELTPIKKQESFIIKQQCT